MADCVVCYRALNGRSEQRHERVGERRGEAALGRAVQDVDRHTSCRRRRWAWRRAAHMERYGTTSEDFGRLAILCRTQRARQRAGDDAQADDHGRLPGQPLDHRAVPHVRLLPRDRRRGGRRGRQRRPRQGPPAPSGACCRARPGAGESTCSTTASPTSPSRRPSRSRKRLYTPPASAPPTSTSPSSTTASPTPCSRQIEGYGFAEAGRGSRHAARRRVRPAGPGPCR